VEEIEGSRLQLALEQVVDDELHVRDSPGVQNERAASSRPSSMSVPRTRPVCLSLRRTDCRAGPPTDAFGAAP
jgi:hypothetical protein